MPYREITYRDFTMSEAIVHGTRETLIPDSPMKKINGPDLILALTAAIKSRNHISRVRGSCCQVNWTFQSPDPRYSADVTCGLTRVKYCHVSL
jgi:hypothetical protein